MTMSCLYCRKQHKTSQLRRTSHQRPTNGHYQWRWRRTKFLLLGEVGACANSAWSCTPKQQYWNDRSHLNHQRQSGSCRQERRRHIHLFLLQAFWWTRGSIPRQRNGRKKKKKERQKKKKKPLLIFFFAFFECDPCRENASWPSLPRGQMRVGTPTLGSGIRSLRNNRSEQTVPQPSPNGPRTNKKDSCSPRDSPPHRHNMATTLHTKTSHQHDSSSSFHPKRPSR